MRLDQDSFGASRPATASSIDPSDGLTAFRASAVEVTSALWRRKGLIFATVLACLIAGLAFIAVTTPLYKATTQIFIDPRSKQVLQSEVTPTGLGTSSNGADSLLVDSQVEIIGSFPVLKSVVDKEHLATDPEFGVTQRSGFRKLLSDIFHSLTGTVASSFTGEDLAIERLQKLLVVKRVGNTYVIDISMFSGNREKAAKIANAVARTFLSDQASAASSSTRDTTQSLTARLDALRTQMIAADGKVEAYRKANNLLGTQGVLLDDRRLQEFNDKLVSARTQLDAAKARYDQAKQLAGGGMNSAATSAGLDSLVVTTMRGKLADIDRQLAKLEKQYGPRYPGIQDLRAERKQAAQQLASEITRLVKRAKSDYELARDDATSVKDSLDRLKGVATQNGEAQIKLRELQSEATAAHAIYDAVLTRTKQSNEQEDIPTSNFRIISPAVPPVRASYPPAGLIIAVSLLAGLVLGCALAWFGHILADRRQAFHEDAPPDLVGRSRRHSQT